MFAIQFTQPGPSSVLHLGERAVPAVPVGGVLVHVHAAGVSPVDIALRSGKSPLTAGLPLPHVPGIDAAGVVVEVGADVTDTKPGDEVFGSVAVTSLGGATAEYAALAHWGKKPTAWTWSQAGAAASSIETGTRALDLLGDLNGANLIIEGAAGGIGAIAAQLAVARGAHVFGTARPESLHAIDSLPGVTPVPAGTDGNELLRDIGLDRFDAALDASGAGVLPSLVAATGAAARVVTIADFAAAQHGVHLTRGALAGEPTGYHGLHDAEEITQRAGLIVPLRGSYPYSQAAHAHDLADTRPRWGKIALFNDHTR